EAFELAPQHDFRDGSLPYRRERGALAQIGAHLRLDHHFVHGVLEGRRGVDRVSVSDALEGALGRDALLEGQLAGDARTGAEAHDGARGDDDPGRGACHSTAPVIRNERTLPADLRPSLSRAEIAQYTRPSTERDAILDAI